MPTNESLIYWDADVVLSYIDGDDDRFAVADSLLEDSENQSIELITSMVSMTEVAYAAHERRGQALDATVLSAIETLWLPRSPIRLIELHRIIAAEGRNIIRAGVERGWTGLRANDAMHLATAKREGVAEFHTYDDRLDKYSAITGFEICRPRNRRLRLFTRPRPVERPSSQGEANPSAGT